MSDNKYHKSKIYTIRSYRTDKYYIGSTCDALHKRLYKHRISYKYYLNGKYDFVSSFDIIKYEDHYIELLEDYKCETRNELTKREGELIRKYKDEIVNCKIEGRTLKEYRNDNKEKIKEYYEDNKDKIKEYYKKYSEDNKDKIKQKDDEYRKNNKDKIKKYYEDNKDKLKQQSKEQYTKLYDCECGKTQIQLGNKSRHIKSKFHLDHI
jgi:hypothetical protein